MPRLKGRVLFIGDETFISSLVVKIISRSGCRADAISPKAAGGMLRERSYDQIILDWVTEEDRDLAFYQQVCALAPESHIYLFTGMSSSQEVILRLNGAREEELSLLNFNALMAAVDPTTLPLIRNLDGRVGDAAGSQ